MKKKQKEHLKVYQKRIIIQEEAQNHYLSELYQWVQDQKEFQRDNQMLQRMIQVQSIILIKVEENKEVRNHNLVEGLKKKSTQKIISLGETIKTLITPFIYNLEAAAEIMIVLTKKMKVALDDMVPKIVRSTIAAVGFDKIKITGIVVVIIIEMVMPVIANFKVS